MAIDPIYLTPESLAAFEAHPSIVRARSIASTFEKRDWDRAHQNSIERMAVVDALPREWRRVVHEKGMKSALLLRARGATPLSVLLEL